VYDDDQSLVAQLVVQTGQAVEDFHTKAKYQLLKERSTEPVPNSTCAIQTPSGMYEGLMKSKLDLYPDSPVCRPISSYTWPVRPRREKVNDERIVISRKYSRSPSQRSASACLN